MASSSSSKEVLAFARLCPLVEGTEERRRVEYKLRKEDDSDEVHGI